MARLASGFQGTARWPDDMSRTTEPEPGQKIYLEQWSILPHDGAQCQVLLGGLTTL
jgi:hypothetical protein